MATVRQNLDAYHRGKMSLDDLANDFSTRQWPEGHDRTAENVSGVHDFTPYDDNDFGVVATDHRLTSAEYTRLYNAKNKSGGKGKRA